MAYPKQAPQIAKTKTPTGALRRVHGDRPSAHDARRAAFLKQVVSTAPTEEVLRNVQQLVCDVRAASSASFLERYRHAR